MLKFIVGFVAGWFGFGFALRSVHANGQWEEFMVGADQIFSRRRGTRPQLRREETAEDILRQYGLR